jgi:Spy/CpxP family protein refolding chaperone
LAERLAQPQVEAATASACVERMCAAENASERATLDHILKVRAVLSPEQQRQYGAALKTQMSGSCPMRVHQP